MPFAMNTGALFASFYFARHYCTQVIQICHTKDRTAAPSSCAFHQEPWCRPAKILRKKLLAFLQAQIFPRKTVPLIAHVEAAATVISLKGT